MILDSSAMVAIIAGEPVAETMVAALNAHHVRRLSAANYLETGIVIDGRRAPRLSRIVDELIESFDISIDPVTERHARRARQAYRDYGKGSGHPARLNYGDCFAYALAIETGEPLLFAGEEFTHTDVRRAL